ncbi:hypothetical protein CLAFUW4_05180 [Fulvia fulva]|uniref:F-box domain-containing protein n=1 Tax=Passalora fulva TaxID=5499 RepID=A0A9Q8PII4_PASFU|nr:uncharacterized protein CLAFUR5_11726 [Fulvia fulva]KAK4626470.1 hypothetical protein CLAFUR4_05166 [Fulvia fulva]KAK4627546.1 hypothetical protein CLAFUR0_05172 [Fulvia fulva]UJO23073.1 hypothetical protein CLAFUR5_11726 [Fulvia fulva]WPV13958.1 hypothetical protein CLAFUW4_05180 [Fulvia fulva]WPV28273.1 hypothetical protein CLAFUW7_05176 [Fulvia fulva]
MSNPTPPATALLLSLPAELRNEIYDLVFAPEPVYLCGATNIYSHQRTKHINLLQSQPPNYALLLTCRQIYLEAMQLYSDGYRAYQTPFAARDRKITALKERRARGVFWD